MVVVFKAQKSVGQLIFFYGGDSRVNLELNLGGKDGPLNKWIDSISQQGHKTFVACDNMFANAVLGGGLDPKSADNFSIYAFETKMTIMQM